ncbi:MAG: hypothetical protein U9R68_06725 [Planctomycetota bacterium]|nr:hypothetical protein [Planctomycetota bacterium]
MKDDKIVVKDWHRAAGRAIVEAIHGRLGPRHTVSVGGESGSGKSEIATALAEALEAEGLATGILQADDYFIYMSRECDALRRKCLDLVGPREVKLDYLDSHLRAFERGAEDIYKPLAVYQEARFEHEVMPLAGLRVLIAEGTYCTLLEFADTKVFIDRDYRDTLADRAARGRDVMDEFAEKILAIEHGTVCEHKAMADIVVHADGTIEMPA